MDDGTRRLAAHRTAQQTSVEMAPVRKVRAGDPGPAAGSRALVARPDLGVGRDDRHVPPECPPPVVRLSFSLVYKRR